MMLVRAVLWGLAWAWTHQSSSSEPSAAPLHPVGWFLTINCFFFLWIETQTFSCPLSVVLTVRTYSTALQGYQRIWTVRAYSITLQDYWRISSPVHKLWVNAQKGFRYLLRSCIDAMAVCLSLILMGQFVEFRHCADPTKSWPSRL